MDMIIDDLFENLQYAKKTKGPVLFMLLRKKAKDIRPAEEDKIGTWHGTGPYKIETGDFIKPVNTARAWSGISQ